MILSHAYEYIFAGIKGFIQQMTDHIKEKLDISQLEDNVFGITGIDEQKEGDKIIMSMDEYTKSMDRHEIR